MAQHATMQYLVKGHIPAIELDFIQPTRGTQQWQQEFGFPEIGLAFFSANLENPTVLGDLVGAYPFVNFHLNKKKTNCKFNLRAGAGLAYITKKFDPLDDHKEIAIGSHVNAIINLRFNTTIDLGNQMRLDAGIGLTHSSNGAFQTPNLGLNIPTLNLGIGYHFHPNTNYYHYDSIPAEKKITYNIIVATGLSEIDPPGGSRYFDYTFSFNRNKKLNTKSTLGFGVDVFYDMSNIQQMKDDSTPFKNDFQDIQLGFKGSYQLTLGRLSLPIEMGFYLFTKYTSDGYIFHRIGLRYQLSNHLIANLTLLTHFAKASYIEWGMGYRF